MRFSILVLPLSALFLCVGFDTSAHAQFFQNSTGLASPTTTITFSEHVLPTNTVLTAQYSDLGVNFSGLYYNPQPFPAPNTVAPQAGNYLSNGTGIVDPYSIFFNTPQTSAALVVLTNTGNSTFTALFHGVSVASGTADTVHGLTNNFFGFSGITFDEIRIDANSGGDRLSLIDNIQLGTASPTPEPSSIALWALSTLTAAAIVRRRKKTRKAV